MGTPRSRTKDAYLGPETIRDLDNFPQRKELGERQLVEEDSEYRLGTSPQKRRAIQAANLGNLGSIPYTSNRHPTDVHDNANRTRDIALRALSDGAKFGGQYALSILTAVSYIARWPIAFCTASFLLITMVGSILKAVGGAFEPLCIIPGISSMSVCKPGPGTALLTTSGGPLISKGTDYSKLMSVQRQPFGQLLGDAAGGLALSLEDVAASGLITCIRVSNLEVQDALVTSLYEFAKDAKKAGRGLQKLTSKVGGAVDNIMAVNNYALQSIAKVQENRRTPWSWTAIFKLSWVASTQHVDKVVMRTFNKAIDAFSASMEQLTVEVELNLRLLNNLEERLITLHRVISCEDSSISSAKSDLLAGFWTKLGGNKKSLRSYDCHLFLLKGWGGYRRQVLVHVIAALQAVHAMNEDMEDMRERMVTPDLMGGAFPAEVRMKSIQTGLERLREGTIRAKELKLEASVRKSLLVVDGCFSVR